MSKLLRKKSKILQLILITSFLINFNPILFAEEKKDCFSYKGVKNTVYPKFIEIETPNSAKWVRRVLKSVKSPRIPKELKKYQSAKISVTYSNKLKCEYLGKVRIHGSTNIHVNDSDLFTSVRIKLSNGNINNITNFSLIKKGARKFEDEIFVSQIFEEMGFISPLNFKTLVSLNQKNLFKEYLFIEEPDLLSLKNRNRNNGLIIAGNRNNRIEKKLSDSAHQLTKSERSITLSRVKNYEGISSRNKSSLLYALDKMNFIYLNSLGIGNGIECCDYLESAGAKTRIEKNYNSNVIFLNFDKIEEDFHFNKLIIYKLLMLATNSHHGLMLEDRSFYYNPTFDNFEPIYRDGDPNIISSKSSLDVSESVVFDFEKKYIDQTTKLLNQINLEEIEKKISSKGLNLNRSQIKKIFKRISNNLSLLKDINEKNFNSLEAQNYFSNHFDKKMKLNLVFGGIDNIFEICNISLDNCKFKKFSDEEFYKLLDKKFISIDGFANKLLYVRFSKNDYINNVKPKNRSIKNEYAEIKIENNLNIFTNDENLININKKDKIIELIQKDENTQFVIIGKSNTPWTINFTGITLDENITHKRNEKMLGGCVNILNSELKNLSINFKNTSCPKAIEILNSKIEISNLIIENSAADAFDAEFSVVKLGEVKIKKTKGECIGVKRGEYFISNAYLESCGDKAISAGELSHIYAKKLDIRNSYVGLYAKNNSKIVAENFTGQENYYCLWSGKSNLGFNGSLISVINDKIDCDKGKLREDNYSKIYIK